MDSQENFMLTILKTSRKGMACSYFIIRSVVSFCTLDANSSYWIKVKLFPHTVLVKKLADNWGNYKDAYYQWIIVKILNQLEMSVSGLGSVFAVKLKKKRMVRRWGARIKRSLFLLLINYKQSSNGSKQWEEDRGWNMKRNDNKDHFKKATLS